MRNATHHIASNRDMGGLFVEHHDICHSMVFARQYFARCGLVACVSAGIVRSRAPQASADDGIGEYAGATVDARPRRAWRREATLLCTLQQRETLGRFFSNVRALGSDTHQRSIYCVMCAAWLQSVDGNVHALTFMIWWILSYIVVGYVGYRLGAYVASVRYKAMLNRLYGPLYEQKVRAEEDDA